MEWFWTLIATTILFCSLCRISYIKGYRSGAKRILVEWKQTLNEGEIDNE